MPTLSELQKRLFPSPASGERTVASDELLIVDSRSGMTPTDAVEQKLGAALRRGRLMLRSVRSSRQ